TGSAWRTTAQPTRSKACGPRAVSRGAGTSVESMSHFFGAARPVSARGELLGLAPSEAGGVAFGCAGAFRIGLQSRVHVACIGPLQRRVDSLEAELVGLRSAPPEAPSLPEVEKRITPIESKIIPPGAIEDPPPATAPVAESGDH